MIEATMGSEHLILGANGFFENLLLDDDAFFGKLSLGGHLPFEGIERVQKTDGKSGTSPHSAACRKVAVVVNLHTTIDPAITQDLPNRRMGDFLDVMAVFDSGINDANLVLEKRWQIAAGKVAILVYGRCQHRSAVGTIPCGIIGSTAKKGNTKWGSADDQSLTLHHL
jgi:hypothetical protein